MLISSLSNNLLLFNYIHVLLTIQTISLTFYEFGSSVATLLMKHLLADAPPPWAQSKQHVLIKPRHYQKYGRFKTIPQYPTLRWKHITKFFTLLFLSSSAEHTIDNQVATKLRHIRWGSSSTRQTFSLPYFDVEVTFPKTTKARLHHNGGWASLSQALFRLPTIATDTLFELDDDPSDIVHMMNFSLTTTNRDVITHNDAPAYFSLLANSFCYMSDAGIVDPPLIIDTGASVYITPLKSDFATYHPSKMRIKDLSLSNAVAGEGMLSWHVVDLDRKQVTITLPGYHIPTAEVRLLSPQLLLAQYGGYSHQTARKIQIHLDSGEAMEASYCNKTRLPMLSTIGNTAGESSFWTKAFDFTSNDARAFPMLLSDSNVNLNASQKELLLWHHKLSHASISWIQLLMRDRKWLRDRNDGEISLHSGPFLPC